MQRMQRLVQKLAATIPAGQNQSNEVNLDGMVIASIVLPNGWTAADLTFLGCEVSGGTFAPVYDDAGVEVKIASANLPIAEKRVLVNKALLEQMAGLTFLKLRSGVAATPVNQGADRTLYLILKG